MALRFIIVAIATVALAASLAHANDPPPLQDFCVAELNSSVLVNGRVCKDPMETVASDFLFSGLNKTGNTSNPLGSIVTAANVNNFAGLNTLGISAARIDFAPDGLNPPHTHPRATEILFVLKGTLLVGFVASNPPVGMRNPLFAQILNEGDLFIFPQGLIHFQLNIGGRNATAFAALSSQNPGVITIANAIFGSYPSIDPQVLTKAFQVGPEIIQYLQAQFWYDNNNQTISWM